MVEAFEIESEAELRRLNDATPEEWGAAFKACYKSPKKKQVGGEHYNQLGIQPVEYITANNLGFLEGNVIKYVTRYKNKGGKQDIQKAIHCLELLLEELQSSDA